MPSLCLVWRIPLVLFVLVSDFFFPPLSGLVLYIHTHTKVWNIEVFFVSQPCSISALLPDRVLCIVLLGLLHFLLVSIAEFADAICTICCCLNWVRVWFCRLICFFGWKIWRNFLFSWLFFSSIIRILFAIYLWRCVEVLAFICLQSAGVWTSFLFLVWMQQIKMANGSWIYLISLMSCFELFLFSEFILKANQLNLEPVFSAVRCMLN